MSTMTSEPLILDGTKLAATLQADLATEIAALAKLGIVPGLAIVQVGENPASTVYVNRKEKVAAAIGIRAVVHRLPTDTTAEALDALVHALAADATVHGIIVQQPFPPHLADLPVSEWIPPKKDVDGFHPESLGRLLAGHPRFIAATPLAVCALLKGYGIQVAGMDAVIIGRSTIVGKPLAMLLAQRGEWGGGATVTLCHTQTRDIPRITRQADLIVSATGSPRSVTADMVRQGAVVIDVGISRIADPLAPKGTRLVGDVDYDAVMPRCSAITPVPGGVGPMTIISLLTNTVRAARNAHVPSGASSSVAAR